MGYLQKGRVESDIWGALNTNPSIARKEDLNSGSSGHKSSDLTTRPRRLQQFQFLCSVLARSGNISFCFPLFSSFFYQGIIQKDFILNNFIIKGNWTITALYGYKVI